MAYKYTNFVEGILDADGGGIVSGATSIAVDFATNSVIPTSLSSSSYMMFVIDPEGAEHAPEVVKATAISGSSNPYTLTVVRNQESSGAKAFDQGRKIVGAVTAAQLTSIVTVDAVDQTVAGTKTFSTQITGDISGDAKTVTIVANDTTDATHFPLFVDGPTGVQTLNTDAGFTYNPNSGILTIGGQLGAVNLDISGLMDIEGNIDCASNFILTGTATIGGVVDITDATEATDATGDTGALRTEGGASIARKLYVGTELHVGTDLDVGNIAHFAGTVNIDGAVDIDATLQVDGAVTTGLNGTGHDVKFYGAATGAHMLWDASEDDLKLVGAAGLDVDGVTNLDNVDIDGTVQIDGAVTVGVGGTGQNVRFFSTDTYMQWTTATNTLVLGEFGVGNWADLVAYGTTSGKYMFWNGDADTLEIAGTVSKTAGSFDIAHPTKGGDWRLRHSFIEGPTADNIYRGTVTISGDSVSVDLDAVSGMTDGTWAGLNTNPWSSVSSSGNAVTWSLSGKTLTITGPDGAVCSWMVIGERKDDGMKDSCIADDTGKLIVEYEKVI